MTHFNTETSVSLENSSNSKTFKTDDPEGMFGTVGLADCEDGVM